MDAPGTGLREGRRAGGQAQDQDRDYGATGSHGVLLWVRARRGSRIPRRVAVPIPLFRRFRAGNLAPPGDSGKRPHKRTTPPEGGAARTQAVRRGFIGWGRGRRAKGGSEKGQPHPVFLVRLVIPVVPVLTPVPVIAVVAVVAIVAVVPVVTVVTVVPVVPVVAPATVVPVVVVIRLVVVEPVDAAILLVYAQLLQTRAEPVVVGVAAAVVVDHDDPVIAAQPPVPIVPPVIVVPAPTLPLLALVLVVGPAAVEPAVESNSFDVHSALRHDDDPAGDRAAMNPDVGAHLLRLRLAGRKQRAEQQRACQQIEACHGVLQG